MEFVKEQILGQATKGKWWMPWRGEAMKDAASCEKPRSAASKRRPGDIRMGKPNLEKSGLSASEFIGSRGELGEVNHLSTRRKRKKLDFLSSGERNGNSLNLECFGISGVVGLDINSRILVESCWKADP